MLLLFISFEKVNKTFCTWLTINLDLAFKPNLNTNITLKPVPVPQTLRQPESDFQSNSFTLQQPSKEINYANHNSLCLWLILSLFLCIWQGSWIYRYIQSSDCQMKQFYYLGQSLYWFRIRSIWEEWVKASNNTYCFMLLVLHHRVCTINSS